MGNEEGTYKIGGCYAIQCSVQILDSENGSITLHGSIPTV
jgi:hypothetical protein